MHIGQKQIAQIGTRLVVQSAQALDRIHLTGQLAEYRCLVAATGPDFQHPAQFAIAAVAQQFGHARHHAGFGNGLSQTDGQTGVLISLVGQGAVDKAVALHAGHGLQHCGVAHAQCHQLVHHALAHRTGVQADALGLHDG